MRQTINGTELRRMIINAAASIEINKQALNDLNVFPVPDGDTGTNMSMTINAAAADLRKLEDPDEREVLRWYYLTLYDNRPLTWQQVAIRMNYYRRHVIRIHGNALQHLAEDGTQ